MENIYLLHDIHTMGGTLICYVCYVHIPDSSHLLLLLLLLQYYLFTYIFLFFASTRVYFIFIFLHKKLLNASSPELVCQQRPKLLLGF